MTMDDPSRGNIKPFGSLAEARVVAHEVRIGADDQPETDKNGNQIPTGLLRIELLDRGEIREHVPYCLPTAGNSSFIGSMPEVGSLCLVGWRAENRPVIIGFLPYGLDNVAAERGTMPTLEPGEVVLQGSKTALGSNKKTQMFAGPRLWFDRHGRIKVDTTDYSMLAGYMLDDEYGPDPQLVEDPEIAEPVLFRERIGTTERRVTQGGSTVTFLSGSSFERVGGDKSVNVGGDFVLQAKNSVSLQDQKQNGLLVTPDDTAQLQANAKARLSSKGNVELDAHGNIPINALGEVSIIAGTGFNVMSVAGLTLGSGGSMSLTSALSMALKSLLGVDITAGGDISLKTPVGDIELAVLGGKVALGIPSALALDPFVLSVELQTFLALMLTNVLAAIGGLTPNPGGGAALGTAVSALSALLASISAPPVAPFASKKVFGI